jgi:HAE1 family hydrophobic/amphiphilic exporter-1
MSMVLIVFLLFGAMAFFGLKQELTPDIDMPAVTITVTYQGAGPREIETQITKPIEDAVSSVSKIDYMQSYSFEGMSMVFILFELDKDVDVASQEIKDKVDAIIGDLPDDAERPVIQKLNPMDKPVVDVVLSGDVPPTELYDIADTKLKDRLSQIAGVATVDVTGGEEREIRIELDERVVFQNRLSLTQLSQILAAENLDMPGGSFKRATQDVAVRLKGEFGSVQDIRELEIPTAFGPRRLGDLAEVKDTGAEVSKRTPISTLEKLGSSNVVVLGVRKSDDGNTVEIATRIKERLPEMAALLPAGCQLTVATDNSVFTQDTVDDTLTTIILGIILTAVILLLFLHDLRSTVIVALSMPMSVISTFLLLELSGYSLNIMTLMGLSTSVGILVSNSVVVIENIFRHKQMGSDRAKAASKGTSQVVAAVLASTLTNIVVFLPLANMTSLVGSFFKSFAMTVVYATFFSLLMSFTLVPMLAKLILPDTLGSTRLGDFFEAQYRKSEEWYRRLLAWTLRGRKRAFAIIAVSVALLAASLAVAGKSVSSSCRRWTKVIFPWKSNCRWGIASMKPHNSWT